MPIFEGNLPMKNEVTLTTDEVLFLIRLPQRLRGTWITWRVGFDPYFLMSKETFYRHAKVLSAKYGVEIRKAYKTS